MARGVESERLAKLLQFQIQQCLDQQYRDRFQVHTYKAISKDNPLKPAISVFRTESIGFSVCWVIDLFGEPDSNLESSDVNSRLYARCAISDYWSLIPSQAELRTYHSPNKASYQQRHLLHVGEQASPTSAPLIALKVQDPLPLSFLTRTLRGQRTYDVITPPLQVSTFQPEA